MVTIGSLSGTATKDTDYEVTTALTSITIPANSANANGTLTITPTNDNVVEGDETIIVSGTTTTEVGLSVSDATITLTDHSTSEQLDSAKLSISGPASPVAEGGNATFTVTLSKAVAAQVQVAWTATGNIDDYSPARGTVTFPASSTTQTVTIAATDDDLSEAAESFTVTLGTITSTLSSQISVDTDNGSATATISESDPITVSITGPSTVDEGDETADYTVSISGGVPSAALTVRYATSNGSATAGSDYTSTSGTLTFTPTDAAAKTFTVQTTQDARNEGSGETFTVTISSPAGGGGSTSLGTSSVTTTIADDDTASTPPPPAPSATASAASAGGDADTRGDTHAYARGDAYTHARGHTHAGGHAYAHAGGDAYTHARGHTHAGGHAYAHAGGDAHAHAGGHAYAHAGGDAHAHAGGDAHAHAGVDRHTDAGVYLHAGGDDCIGGDAHAHAGGDAHARDVACDDADAAARDRSDGAHGDRSAPCSHAHRRRRPGAGDLFIDAAGPAVVAFVLVVDSAADCGAGGGRDTIGKANQGAHVEDRRALSPLAA